MSNIFKYSMYCSFVGSCLWFLHFSIFVLKPHCFCNVLFWFMSFFCPFMCFIPFQKFYQFNKLSTQWPCHFCIRPYLLYSLSPVWPVLRKEMTSPKCLRNISVLLWWIVITRWWGWYGRRKFILVNVCIWKEEEEGWILKEKRATSIKAPLLTIENITNLPVLSLWFLSPKNKTREAAS